MLWLSILTTVTFAAPEAGDARRLADIRAILAADTVTSADTPAPTAALLLALQDPDLDPLRRTEIVAILSHTPAPPTRALCRLLLTPGDGPLALRQRIDAATVLSAQQPPEALGPLLVAFARSRVDDLREDPDVFERALRGAVAIARAHPEALHDALEVHLAPALLDLARARLRAQWLDPLYGPADAARLLPPADPDLQAHLARLLLDAHDRHGIALLEAMQTEQGSLLIDALLLAEDAILAAPGADPRLAQVRAQRPLPPAAEDGELLAPPRAPPGSAPGVEPLETPLEPPTAAWSFPAPRPSGTLPLLAAGLLVVVGAGLLGARTQRLRPLAGVGLALGLLLSAEGGLRVAGVQPLSAREPLFAFTDWQVEVTVPQGSRLVTPGGWIRYQDIDARPADFRAVTLGASSAHGSNHLREESFSALLESSLRRRWPDRTIEVLNFGIGGTISDGVRIAGRRALDLDADLLLIYYGHNEVAQFTRLAQYARVSPGRLAVLRRLRQSTLYGLLADGLAPPAAIAAPADALPEGPPSAQDIAQLKALAVENLRHNLSQLLQAAAQQGTRVVLMSPATNYPFAELSPLSEAPADTTVLGELDRLRGSGRQTEALALARDTIASAEVGSATHLEVLRRQAELYAEAGEREAARAALQAALDASAQPGVITSPIRAELRSLSAQYGAPLLDVDRLLHADSPDGLHAPGMFWDDLHPTRAGHRRIAEALLPVVSTAAAERLDP